MPVPVGYSGGVRRPRPCSEQGDANDDDDLIRSERGATATTSYGRSATTSTPALRATHAALQQQQQQQPCNRRNHSSLLAGKNLRPTLAPAAPTGPFLSVGGVFPTSFQLLTDHFTGTLYLYNFRSRVLFISPVSLKNINSTG